MLDNTSNQPTKFRAKNWFEINDESRETYNTNIQIKLKTSMLGSSLCDYGDAYILVIGTIIVLNTVALANTNNRKNLIIKNCAPFTDFIIEINNTQIDKAKWFYIVMPMYNLIEYSDNYSRKSRSLWQYYRDEIFLNYNDAITDFKLNR